MIVNHVWLRHFGAPLVEPVNDFGLRTPEPLHRELLDWLAVELIESRWSLRHLHRLLVTSRAYRLTSVASASDELSARVDPGVSTYWRWRSKRLESQAVRDSLLALGGRLDLELGGPPVDSQASSTSRRRSLYLWHSRDGRDPFLASFDDAEIFACYRRSETIVPQQALTMSNSRLALETARRLRSRIDADGVLPAEIFLERAFLAVLASRPDPQERAACLETLAKLEAIARNDERPDPRARARDSLVHALLNHNDFVTVR